MNVAILTISSLSLVVSLGTLAIMAKTAHELKTAKTQIEYDVQVFKEKTDRNVSRIKSTLNDLEL